MKRRVRGVNGVAIAFIILFALLLLPGHSAQAGNTTVVVSVSIGGGVALGSWDGPFTLPIRNGLPIFRTHRNQLL